MNTSVEDMNASVDDITSVNDITNVNDKNASFDDMNACEAD